MIKAAEYGMIKQNNALNQAARVTSKRNTSKTRFNSQMIKCEDITAITTAARLGVAEAQMLDYINYKFNEQPNHDSAVGVTISLKEYMDDLGKKDAKTARNALKDTLDNLVGTTYSYDSKANGKSKYNQGFGKHALLEGYDYKSGKAEITFTGFYTDLLKENTMPMPYHRLALKLNPQRDATAFLMLRALEVNKRTNPDSPRGNRMKVETLLAKLTTLSTYSEVMSSSSKHTTARIIKPFIKALDRLTSKEDGALDDYQLVNNTGGVLDANKADFETFKNATLSVVWRNYPEENLKKWAKKRRKHQSKK